MSFDIDMELEARQFKVENNKMRSEDGRSQGRKDWR